MLFINFLKLIIPKNIHPLNYITNRAIKFINGKVALGPFKGMLYIDDAYVGFVCHKVTGTYEKEIQQVINDELLIEYDAIIDVGSAEGYYAVGMALFSKAHKVISYEGSDRGRELQKKLIKLNNVNEIIELKEYCDEHILARRNA